MRSLDTFKRQETHREGVVGNGATREKTGRGQLLDVLQTKTQLALLVAQIADA